MIVDLVILAVVALCVFVGAKRGLIVSLISVLALVIALVAGYLLMPVVGGVIEQTAIAKQTEEAVYVYFNDALSAQGSDSAEAEDSLVEENTVDYKAMLAESSLPDFIKGKVESVLDRQANAEQSVEEISRTAAQSITSAAIKILAVLLVATVVFILLNSMKFLWKGLRDISVIRKIDTVGGVAFGFAQSILLVFAGMLVVGLLSAGGLATGVAEQVQDSFLGGLFYEYNFLGALIALFI